MDYDVTAQAWWQGGALVARPKTPAAVPLFGDAQGYLHWVTVNGVATSAAPCPAPRTDPWGTPDFTVHGFWLKDPQLSGIGQNAYVTAAECQASYFKPVASADAYDGRFVQVAEPPARTSPARARVKRPVADPANLAYLGVLAVDDLPRAYPKKQRWQDLVDPVLLTDPRAVAAFAGAEMGEPLLVLRIDTGEDYYLVPFGERGLVRFFASGVLVFDVAQGHFKEAAWTEAPEAFLEVDEQEARRLLRRHLQGRGDPWAQRRVAGAGQELIWEPGGPSRSVYQPYWRLETDEQTWLVTQQGEVLPE